MNVLIFYHLSVVDEPSFKIQFLVYASHVALFSLNENPASVMIDGNLMSLEKNERKRQKKGKTPLHWKEKGPASLKLSRHLMTKSNHNKFLKLLYSHLKRLLVK